jgi:hypothetical protein
MQVIIFEDSFAFTFKFVLYYYININIKQSQKFIIQLIPNALSNCQFVSGVFIIRINIDMFALSRCV